ncbi:MAG: hypothetical protein UY65_C0009G0007 [Parcubacteria group bacterium GW2011_GWA2_51_12]|nr:MAG: hypothetical protein UY65_C0009G0007 [Parcubacteria group bacterium GW2011_GWA2_51_12]
MQDNDLIPDEWQAGSGNSNVHKEYAPQAAPGSQVPAKPPTPAEEPVKKQGVLGRLFGFGQPKKAPGETATPAALPKKADWNPIDFSKTPRITSGIYGARSSFESHVKKQLKSDLGSVLDANQRKEVADMMANKRGHGLRRDEVRKELRKMEESGKLNKFERKRIERKLGANKSSSFF